MTKNTHKKVDSKGFTVWFTGLACSGKTTIADAVVPLLKKKGFKVERLDGDVVRQSLTRDLGFSAEDRRKNIERVTFVAKLLTRNDVAVLATFISPEIAMRANSPTEAALSQITRGLFSLQIFSASDIEAATGLVRFVP